MLKKSPIYLSLSLVLLIAFTGVRDVDSYTNALVNTCENNDMILSCSNGNVLEINSAIYGRKSSSICGSGSHRNARCTVDVKDYVSNQCNGRSECHVRVANDDLRTSDPCYGVPKYLEVSSVCKASDVRNWSPTAKVFVCENDKRTLRCPYGQKLSVKYAAFGRNNVLDNNVCHQGRDTYSLCPQKDVTKELKLSCDYQNTCDVVSDVLTYGDPCPTVYKYLKMEFECVNDYNS